MLYLTGVLFFVGSLGFALLLTAMAHLIVELFGTEDEMEKPIKWENVGAGVLIAIFLVIAIFAQT